MKNRVDVLPPRRGGLENLKGAMLDPREDPALQALVATASEQLNAPIALVSLVLEQIQLFRAHQGLPADLAAAGATDRDVSFCQFVVRDRAMFTVEDATCDTRVPQALVEEYGIRAYLGAPVFLGNDAVGALCVIDTQPRTFGPADRCTLERLATRVSERLEAMTTEPSRLASLLHDRAVRPQFAELRNRLVPMMGAVSGLRIAATELRAMQRAEAYARAAIPAVPITGVLTRASSALDDLDDVLAELDEGVTSMRDGILALEAASLVSSRTATLAHVLEAAGTLAHHYTKLVAGVNWLTPVPSGTVRAPVATAVNAIAAALAAIAMELQAHKQLEGLSITITPTSDAVTLRFDAPTLPAATHAWQAGGLARLLDSTGIVVQAHPGGIALQLPFAPAVTGASLDGAAP